MLEGALDKRLLDVMFLVRKEKLRSHFSTFADIAVTPFEHFM